MVACCGANDEEDDDVIDGPDAAPDADAAELDSSASDVETEGCRECDPAALALRLSAGPLADCGHYDSLAPDAGEESDAHFFGYSDGGNVRDESWACAAERFNLGEAFQVSLLPIGIDSCLERRFVGTEDGQFYRVSYDSDPGGGGCVSGPSGDASLLYTPCAAPEVVDGLLRCSAWDWDSLEDGCVNLTTCE